MASEGWGNSGGGGEGARLAFCSARGRQSLSGASLYSRSFLLLSSMLVSSVATRPLALAAASSASSLVPLSLRPYSSRPARRDGRGRDDSSYDRSRKPLRRTGNWGGNSTQWGGGDGGFQSGGYGGGGQRSTACFNCGQGEFRFSVYQPCLLLRHSDSSPIYSQR